MRRMGSQRFSFGALDRVGDDRLVLDRHRCSGRVAVLDQGADRALDLPRLAGAGRIILATRHRLSLIRVSFSVGMASGNRPGASGDCNHPAPCPAGL